MKKFCVVLFLFLSLFIKTTYATDDFDCNSKELQYSNELSSKVKQSINLKIDKFYLTVESKFSYVNQQIDFYNKFIKKVDLLINDSSFKKNIEVQRILLYIKQNVYNKVHSIEFAKYCSNEELNLDNLFFNNLDISNNIEKVINISYDGKKTITLDNIEGTKEYEVYIGSYFDIVKTNSYIIPEYSPFDKSQSFNIQIIATDGKFKGKTFGKGNTKINYISDLDLIKVINISYDGKKTITWDNIEGTKEYEVYIGSYFDIVKTNSYIIPEYSPFDKSQNFNIQIIATDGKFKGKTFGKGDKVIHFQK